MRQLMHSFHGFSVPQDVLDAVRRGEVTAFCLFNKYNVTDPAQVRELTTALHHAAAEGGHLPPMIGIDQEGGQLIAIRGGATELPGNMAVGATRDPELARQAGYVLGRELLAMGINLNFAPSLDVNINPLNPVIGIRAFGDDPHQVAELGVAFIKGMESTGVMASAKHFPGHGDTAGDTHHIVAVVNHSLERMNEVELVPFRAAIKAGVTSVMSAHVLFSALDPDNPATISSAVLNQFLRRDLGYDGIIMSDAMDMYAVNRYGDEECIRMALAAGCDIVMMGHIKNQLALNAALRSAENPAGVARLEAARRKLPSELPPLDVVGCAEHQQIAQTIADRSMTLVRNNAQQLPLRPKTDDLIAVITPEPVDLTPADTSSYVEIDLADAVQRRHPRVKAYQLPHELTDADVQDILEATQDAQIVIVGTISAERHAGQADLVEALYRRGQTPIVVALRTPYDIVAFPMIDTYLCTYGIRSVSMEAAAKVLFGEIEAQGVLPCAIPGIVAS